MKGLPKSSCTKVKQKREAHWQYFACVFFILPKDSSLLIGMVEGQTAQQLREWILSVLM